MPRTIRLRHLEVAPVHRLRCDAHGEVLDRPKANISPRRVFKDKMIPLIEQRETGAGLSLAAMCRVLEVSRAAYYRARQPPAGDNETALRDAIQRIAGGALLRLGSARESAVRIFASGKE